MPTDFPLWRLKPEDAARIIILEPLKPVQRHKFWRKREQRLKASDKKAIIRSKPQYKPRTDELPILNRAYNKPDGYAEPNWEAWAEEYAKEFPVIGVLQGPLLKSGQYFSQPQTTKVANPLATERPREPWQGMYSREQFEIDTAYFEAARALLLENFYLGQTGDGPYLDGLVYQRVDSLLLAEIDHCKARLQLTWAILSKLREEKNKARPKSEKIEHWHNIGNDEAVAMQFKQSGHTIRKIDTLTNRHYEVLMK